MIDSGEHFSDSTKMIGFDLERARGLRDFLQDDCAEVGDVWGEMIAEIERLRAENAWLKSDREFQSEEQAARIKSLKKEIRQPKHESKVEVKFTNSYIKRLHDAEARIKELESSLDEAETLTKKNAELMNGYLGRIAELEDALVEGLTNFLHYRASCYDPARRCPYAKECDDCSTWDACGHVEKFRSEARRQLQAEGKIGPDAKPRSWQITEERIGLLEYCLETLLDAPDIEEIPGPGHSIEMLRAMLREAEQCE